MRPWDSLSDEEKRLFARMAEVYAGFVSYTDDQIARLIDYLDESGQLDNTIIVVVSDNGASGEGGPNGSFNENKFFNNVPDSIEANLERLDELGSPNSYNHYNTGWAWAFDTPFPYWKRFAGYEGGVADPLLVAWPKGIRRARRRARPVRPRGRHRADDLRDARHRAARGPEGLHAEPDRGRELRAAPSRTRRSQDARLSSTRCSGMRALYHQGWLANTLHPPISGWGKFDLDEWELYNLAEDRSQLRNLAAEHPDKLNELKELWSYYAGIYKGLPLDDRTALEIIQDVRPQPSAPRDRYIYYPGAAEVPESVSVNVRRRSFTIAAAVDLQTPEAEGVLFSQGARAAATPSTSRTGAFTTPTTGSASASRPSAQTSRCPPEATSSARSFRRPVTTSRR